MYKLSEDWEKIHVEPNSDGATILEILKSDSLKHFSAEEIQLKTQLALQTVRSTLSRFYARRILERQLTESLTAIREKENLDKILDEIRKYKKIDRKLPYVIKLAQLLGKSVDWVDYWVGRGQKRGLLTSYYKRIGPNTTIRIIDEVRGAKYESSKS